MNSKSQTENLGIGSDSGGTRTLSRLVNRKIPSTSPMLTRLPENHTSDAERESLVHGDEGIGMPKTTPQFVVPAQDIGSSRPIPNNSSSPLFSKMLKVVKFLQR